MKPLSELRATLDFYPHELNSWLVFFTRDAKIDWDVYLPSLGINLQRGFVWTLKQKQELIWSILMRRNIPRMAFVYTVDDVYKIIDGKQRLSAMIGFLKGGFALEYLGVHYRFSDLPKEHQSHLNTYGFPYYVYNEEYGKPLTDQQLVSWFMFINFAGTPQDEKHFEKLNKIANQ